MTAEEIRAVEQAATTPARRLAVALAAVHAARAKAIRDLTLDDIDLPNLRIIAGHRQRLGELTRDALLGWLEYRRATWPNTANRYVLVSRISALGADPVAPDYLDKHQLPSISLERIRRDRILHEALATGADPLHLALVFNIDHTNAMAYANAARNLLNGRAEQILLPAPAQTGVRHPPGQARPGRRVQAAMLALRYYNDYANRYGECLAWPMSIRHALLALLSEGPKYGLRLQQEFEERTGEVWPLNVGQVYITLQRLERAGLVESDGEGAAGPQKRYVITQAGGAELDGWLRTPAGDIPPPRDELVIKVLISLRVPGADVHDIVQAHRRHMIELMQRYWHLKAQASEDDVGLALVADAELFRLEGIIRWLDAADARLKLHPAPGPAGPPATEVVPAPPVRRSGTKARR